MHYQSQQHRAKNTIQKKIKTAIFYCLTVIFLCWSTGNLATIAQNNETEGLNSSEMRQILDRGDLTAAVTKIEEDWEEDFQKYFAQNFSGRSQTATAIAKNPIPSSHSN
jgi:hypothetical protein